MSDSHTTQHELMQIYNMSIQTIDNYRLTSLEEPTDEVLAQLMHEAAEEAKRRRAEATARFFGNLRQDANKISTAW